LYPSSISYVPIVIHLPLHQPLSVTVAQSGTVKPTQIY
jgi:hypothetical protein